MGSFENPKNNKMTEKENRIIRINNSITNIKCHSELDAFRYHSQFDSEVFFSSSINRFMAKLKSI